MGKCMTMVRRFLYVFQVRGGLQLQTLLTYLSTAGCTTCVPSSNGWVLFAKYFCQRLQSRPFLLLFGEVPYPFWHCFLICQIPASQDLCKVSSECAWASSLKVGASGAPWVQSWSSTCHGRPCWGLWGGWRGSRGQCQAVSRCLGASVRARQEDWAERVWAAGLGSSWTRAAHCRLP